MRKRAGCTGGLKNLTQGSFSDNTTLIRADVILGFAGVMIEAVSMEVREDGECGD
jgi:hypothetical protein